MIIQRRSSGAIQRPLFFALNSLWKGHLIRLIRGNSGRIGCIFQASVFAFCGLYLALKFRPRHPLPGGFKNPNHFCFGHALFQVLFASKKFSKFLSPHDHQLKQFEKETRECLKRRKKMQEKLYEIRQRIYDHKTISSTESYRLRREFHLINREIPEQGQWDLCEFSETVFNIIQSPDFEFDFVQTKNVLPTRFTANSFYLNPKCLTAKQIKKNVSIDAIPLLVQKIKTTPEDPDIVEQLPVVTLKNVIFNSGKSPDFLTIQISRANLCDLSSSNKNFIRLKNFSHLKFHLDGTRKKIGYHLIGSCEHEGTVKGGHYYSLIRYPIDGERQWIKCNSSSVSIFKSQKLYDLIGRKGCFYFYEKV